MDTHPNITLSTGKVITHERMENGAQKAFPEMSEREHAEYVERLTALFHSPQFKRSIIRHCQTCGKPFQYYPVEGECLCSKIEEKL